MPVVDRRPSAKYTFELTERDGIHWVHVEGPIVAYTERLVSRHASARARKWALAMGMAAGPKVKGERTLVGSRFRESLGYAFRTGGSSGDNCAHVHQEREG